jgi:HTH-type transcriptional regulator, sugar sensing transcriptional regulator
MNTEILEDLGLTNAEIKVYLALLELGNSSAGPILEKSKLQNSVVHMTLHKLIDKGLITYIKQGKRNLYQATNPNHLLEFVEEKKKRIKEILPELLIKQKLAKEKPEIITFSNIRGIRELLEELLNAEGKEHLTFGSTKQSLMLGDAWWRDYHKKRASKGIKAKLLFNKSLSYWKAETKYPKAEVRYTEEGFEPLTETIIRNNKIGIIIWAEKPLGVLINQKEAARSYGQFFNLMWGSAKK